MSVKPIELQVMFPKTSELAKTYHDEANKNQTIHQQQAEANRERIDNSLKQVVARENVQHGRVDEKKEKDHSRENKNKKKQQKNLQKPTIDIRI